MKAIRQSLLKWLPLVLKTKIMKRIQIILVLCAVLVIANNAYSQREQAFKIENRIFDPWHIHHLGNDSLIVIDIKNDLESVQVRRLPDGKIIGSQRLGRGPGELSPVGDKIVNMTDDYIFIWDSGARQFLQYDWELTYKSSVFTDLPLMYLAPFGDSQTVASIAMPGSDYLHLYNYKEREIDTAPKKTFTTDQNDRLAPIKNNYLLRQGPFLVEKNSLYMGFAFSSLVLKVGTEGLDYLINKPEDIPLPEYYFQSNVDGDAVVSAPSINEFPYGTLDLDVDEDYLYVLHSGKKLEAGRLRMIWLSATGKIAEEIENIEYSKKIFVYDKQVGTYLGEIQLLQRAKKIAVSKDYFTILSITEEGFPAIIGYDKYSVLEGIVK